MASQIGQSLRRQGWWALGAWYQTFAQANTTLNAAIVTHARISGESLIGDRGIDDFNKKVMAAKDAQQTQDAGNSHSASSQPMQGTNSTEAAKIMGSFFSAPGQRLVLATTRFLSQQEQLAAPRGCHQILQGAGKLWSASSTAAGKSAIERS